MDVNISVTGSLSEYAMLSELEEVGLDKRFTLSINFPEYLIPGIHSLIVMVKEVPLNETGTISYIWDNIIRSVNEFEESDYIAYAELHADVNLGGKDYLFAVNMGHYDSFTEYNDIKERQRQIDKIYEEGQGNEWEWDNTQNRINFDSMRIKSVNYEIYARFAIGGLVLHRFISLIDVIYLERRNPKISLMPQISTHTGNLQFKLQLLL